MFHKVLIYCFLSFFTLSVHAKQEFYFGIGGGYQSLNGVFETSNTTTNLEIGGDGIHGLLFLGYRVPIRNDFLLGLEINAEPSTTKMRVDFSGFDNSLQMIGGFGIGIKPTYRYDDKVILFATGGYQVSKFTATVLSISVADRWVDAFRYGLGAEYKFTSYLGFRAEAVQTRYRKYRDIIRPVTNQTMVALVWYFS